MSFGCDAVMKTCITFSKYIAVQLLYDCMVYSLIPSPIPGRTLGCRGNRSQSVLDAQVPVSSTL